MSTLNQYSFVEIDSLDYEDVKRFLRERHLPFEDEYKDKIRVYNILLKDKLIYEDDVHYELDEFSKLYTSNDDELVKMIDEDRKGLFSYRGNLTRLDIVTLLALYNFDDISIPQTAVNHLIKDMTLKQFVSMLNIENVNKIDNSVYILFAIGNDVLKLEALLERIDYDIFREDLDTLVQISLIEDNRDVIEVLYRYLLEHKGNMNVFRESADNKQRLFIEAISGI